MIFAKNSRSKRQMFYADFDNEAINTDGIIIFYYILHDDDFFCERAKDIDKMYDRLYKFVRNPSIGEFMVFKDGTKRHYRIKTHLQKYFAAMKSTEESYMN